MWNKKLAIVFVLGVVIAVATIIGLMFFLSSRNLEDVSVVKGLVGRHYTLPADEEPALATVEDKTKVKSEFFRAAENGDKLLVYKNAKKVILYRPSIDRIIEVGPVSMADMGE